MRWTRAFSYLPISVSSDFTSHFYAFNSRRSAVFFNCSRVKAPVDPFWTAVKSLLELVVMVILASMHASSSAVGSNITVSPTLAPVWI